MALTDLVLASIPSPSGRRNYAKAIRDLAAFSNARPLTLVLLLEWRGAMATKLASGTVNGRISAVRKLIQEARRTGLIDGEDAADLLQIDGLPHRGSNVGNWLTRPQVRQLLAVPSRKTLRGKRNYCILALLVGCGLRRSELAALEVKALQLREARWVLADIKGKGGRVRTVAVPAWVMQAIREWGTAAKIETGKLIRRLTLQPEGLSSYAIWEIVTAAANKIGVPNFGPHDLRRTCAQLCRTKGGDIEQIQFMLGHASIVTTQRYLGTLQNLETAVNDNLGI
jgi:integrase